MNITREILIHPSGHAEPFLEHQIGNKVRACLASQWDSSHFGATLMSLRPIWYFCSSNNHVLFYDLHVLFYAYNNTLSSLKGNVLMLGGMSNKTYVLIDALKNEVVQHRTRKKKYHPQK